ncbi:MAG TPA: UDP-N-acetylmuramate--L-alanine ligase [Flavobacterium sp.]|nr:UDP-N-acetylmuramate--L-alanine ligase [Flavobacterium sp.]
MNLNHIQNIYFIGIGGIGMSALARYFKNIGKQVYGYDKTPTQLTSELQQESIVVGFEDVIDAIPNHFSPQNTLVVITPAVPATHKQWNYFSTHHYTIKKRAQVLGLITKDTFCFAVAGTHGKTTTSSILAHILFESGLDVTSFLGGIVENYNSNLVGNGTSITVVEADEFDRSFLHLYPNMACITSMDADHLDIYGDALSIEVSFREFASKIEDKSNLFYAHGLDLQGVSVGVNSSSQIKAQNIKIENGFYVFDAQLADECIKNIQFSLPGHHNLSNALMALAMARKYGVDTDKIKNALASFKGIRRRFSFVIKEKNLTYIDDYAHHPTEINAVHQAVRELFPTQKICAIFQPHLFSRTKDFASDFAKSLSQFDEILLMEIYPAREQPLPGVTSSWLLEKIDNNHKKLVQKQDLKNYLNASSATVFITIGAGDLGEMVSDIKQMLYEKN